MILCYIKGSKNRQLLKACKTHWESSFHKRAFSSFLYPRFILDLNSVCSYGYEATIKLTVLNCLQEWNCYPPHQRGNTQFLPLRTCQVSTHSPKCYSANTWDATGKWEYAYNFINSVPKTPVYITKLSYPPKWEVILKLCPLIPHVYYLLCCSFS